MVRLNCRSTELEQINCPSDPSIGMKSERFKLSLTIFIFLRRLFVRLTFETIDLKASYNRINC